ncbi:MAG: alkene reductase [Planctomycetota bacterium]
MADILFEPIELGEITAPNRVFMAPLTRSRSRQPGDVPWELNAEYYRQRAGAGLIISEATQVSPTAKGYAFTPGMYSAEQIKGWKLVTDAVHGAGGRIFAQLWHVGRVSHVDLQPSGQAPVAPSAIRGQNQTYIGANSGRVPVSEPRALDTDEIPGVVDEFRLAAKNAKDAGFDGVEIHGANSYLLDQFLRDGTNKRTDAYGGSVANRMRFCLEVTDAVLSVWGPGRVGYRVSPMGSPPHVQDSDTEGTFGQLAVALGERGLAYLHAVEQFKDTVRDPHTEEVLAAVRLSFRASGGGLYIGNGAYDAALARQRIGDGLCDAVAFGKLFISNPDLPDRFRTDAPLAEWDAGTFYTGDHRGYTDYPLLNAR